MPDDDLTAALKRRDKLISNLITKLAGLQTLVAAIDATMSMEDVFEHTETCQAIGKLVAKAHGITFSGVTAKEKGNVSLAQITGCNDIAEAARTDALGKFKLAQTDVYKQIRGGVSQYAGRKVGKNGG